MKAAIVIISAVMTLSLLAQSERAEQITVPLSRPDEPGVLIVHHHKGSLNVTGYDGTSLVVKASPRYESEAATQTVDLGAVEKDNHVVLSVSPRHRTVDLDIMVPRRFSLRLKNDDSGTIRVQHLSGEIEVSNLNGDIHLIDVAGSALLDTVDGNIIAEFNSLTPGVPMAFTSLEGNLDITFPADARALVKTRADHGRIHNEFASAPAAETSPGDEAGQAPWTYTRINGGGPEIRLRSFYGHVRVRRAENDENAAAAVTIPDERSST
jgi:hypothetical protein